jgi:hypothetical protein
MDLSIEEIERAAAGMKEDLQRKANQGILRNDLNRAMTALAGITHINDFVYLLRIHSGSELRKYVPRKRGRPRREPEGNQ